MVVGVRVNSNAVTSANGAIGIFWLVVEKSREARCTTVEVTTTRSRTVAVLVLSDGDSWHWHVGASSNTASCVEVTTFVGCAVIVGHDVFSNAIGVGVTASNTNADVVGEKTFVEGAVRARTEILAISAASVGRSDVTNLGADAVGAVVTGYAVVETSCCARLATSTGIALTNGSVGNASGASEECWLSGLNELCALLTGITTSLGYRVTCSNGCIRIAGVAAAVNRKVDVGTVVATTTTGGESYRTKR